ncbi:MAG: hypothetical protein GX331_05405 [Firmicutes bacterium]|jgi:flagellar FliL protein|nr:hypothetical protein [Bacillota bacterium]
MAKKVEVDFKLLLGAIALVIIATVGSAYTTYLIFRTDSDPAQQPNPSAVSTKRELGPTFDAGEFTVNLSTTGMQSRFIRTGIVLEGQDKKTAAELERREPQIRDQIITILRSRTAEQLRSETGLELLRMEIIGSINDLLINGEVADAFFIDLVIQ